MTQRCHQTSGQQERRPPWSPAQVAHPPVQPETATLIYVQRLGDLAPIKCTTGRGGEDSSPRRVLWCVPATNS